MAPHTPQAPRPGKPGGAPRGCSHAWAREPGSAALADDRWTQVAAVVSDLAVQHLEALQHECQRALAVAQSGRRVEVGALRADVVEGQHAARIQRGGEVL